MASRPRNLEMAFGAVIAVVLAAVFLLHGGGSTARRSGAPAPPTARHAGSSQTGVVRWSALPAEARQTVRRVRAGGPFPYSHDGAIFENREGHLPAEPRGYYHEYTVATPGAVDRGPRRIVAGQQGDLFYTDDHYQSFKRIEGIR
jgi:ribonuclease T1